MSTLNSWALKRRVWLALSHSYVDTHRNQLLCMSHTAVVGPTSGITLKRKQSKQRATAVHIDLYESIYTAI